MKKYKNISSWNVCDTIKDGKEVFLIDKEMGVVLTVSEMPTGMLMQVITECENRSLDCRYEFYCIEKEQEATTKNV